MIDGRAREVLARMERQDAGERERNVARAVRLRQITPDVGRLLHTLVLAARPRAIIEIGTSGGYSTIWLATAARDVGASVTTIEIDPVKVRLANANLHAAGVDDVATIAEGDAFAHLRTRAESIDFVFRTPRRRTISPTSRLSSHCCRAAACSSPTTCCRTPAIWRRSATARWRTRSSRHSSSRSAAASCWP